MRERNVLSAAPNAHNAAFSAPPSLARSGGAHASCRRGAAAWVGLGSSCSGRTESVTGAVGSMTSCTCRREPRQPAEAPGAGAGRRLGADRKGRFFLPLPVSRLHACPHPASAWARMEFGHRWPLGVHPRPTRQGCAPVVGSVFRPEGSGRAMLVELMALTAHRPLDGPLYALCRTEPPGYSCS